MRKIRGEAHPFPQRVVKPTERGTAPRCPFFAGEPSSRPHPIRLSGVSGFSFGWPIYHLISTLGGFKTAHEEILSAVHGGIGQCAHAGLLTGPLSGRRS